MPWRDFNPITGMSSSKKKEEKALKYLMYLKEKREFEESRTEDALTGNPSKNILKRLTHHCQPHCWRQ
jgi:hypothetical protein